MHAKTKIDKIDLHHLTREDVENIKNPTLRRAVINALFLQTVTDEHANHNSHTEHSQYTQSIEEEIWSENVLDFIFGRVEKPANP